MKIRHTILLFFAVAIMTMLPLGLSAALKVSILGDSYSTFEGAIPEGNACWYHPAPRNLNDVVAKEETWWSKTIAALGGELEVNESYSGATVCNAGNRKGAPDLADYSDRSFITRSARLGKPDLILVCGGTNDSWAGVPIGTNVWENWSGEDLRTYRGGLACMFDGLRNSYPQARVVFVLNCDLKPSIDEATHEICRHYAVPCVDLRAIDKQRSHPSKAGMEEIARQVVRFLRAMDVSKKLSEQFLSTDPTLYKPQGYRGGKPYGGGEIIHYATASLWVNALECARFAADTNLEERLAGAFAPCRARPSVMNQMRHVDLSIVGAVPLEIAILTGSAQDAELGLHYADTQWSEPSEGCDWGDRWYDPIPLSERHAWWENGYTPQTRLWIDDMYMITVLQSQAYRFSGDEKYIERAGKEMCLYLERLQREDGLFNHSPEAPYAWGRGNGWMAAGMALNLKHLAQNSEWRPKILAGYRKMMATLVASQRESGLWGQLVDDEAAWDETSGSAMFAFAIAEGLAHGWLDGVAERSRLEAVVDRAFAALCSKLDEYGNLADVCVGTGWRNDHDYYLKRGRCNGDPHGQAPLLWLCGAMMKP